MISDARWVEASTKDPYGAASLGITLIAGAGLVGERLH